MLTIFQPTITGIIVQHTDFHVLVILTNDNGWAFGGPVRRTQNISIYGNTVVIRSSLKNCGSIVPGILTAATLAAAILSSQTHAAWIAPDTATPFEFTEYSFGASEGFSEVFMYDFFFVPSANQTFSEPHSALDIPYKIKTIALQNTEKAHEIQSAENYSKDVVGASDDWTGGDTSMRDARTDAQINMVRYPPNNIPDAINEKELEQVSDPSRYMDQYVYNTVTTYVRHSGVDIDDALTSATSVSGAISTSVHKANQYVPGQLRSQPASKSDPTHIQIAPFGETLPGRLFYWFSNPENFGIAIILFFSILAGVLGLNRMFRKIANNPVLP